MRNFRAYCPDNSIGVGTNYQLGEQTSHHLAKVLRVSMGDFLEVFDGQGHRYEAKIESLKPKVTVKILKEKPSNTVSPLRICLMIAVGKGDKMDWIVQKATELGVAEIIPLIASRGEVRLSPERWQKKIDHWKEISINACEQCGLDRLPKIHEAVDFAKACQTATVGLKLLLHPDGKAQSFCAVIPAHAGIHVQDCKMDSRVRGNDDGQGVSAEISLLVGPEGGFDEREVASALAKGFQLASLGPRILRMETAAITAIALAQALLGDL